MHLLEVVRIFEREVAWCSASVGEVWESNPTSGLYGAELVAERNISEFELPQRFFRVAIREPLALCVSSLS